MSAQDVEAILQSILTLTRDTFDDGFHRRLAQRLAEALGCHTAFVSRLIDPDGDARVRTLAVWSRGQVTPNVEYQLVGSPCAEVMHTGLLQVDSDVFGRYPEDLLLDEIGAESYLGAVLLNPQGQPVGHLAALDDHPMHEDPARQAILRIFAARASVELDRRVVDQRLRTIEDNFRILFEQSPNAIILFDPESWKPVEFNDLAAEFMGYSRDEFAQLTISDLEFDPNPEETREHIRRIRSSGSDSDVFEALHQTKTGDPRHVMVSLRMMDWRGREVMLTLWHDITVRKAAEQALEVSERRLQNIFDSAMDAIVIVDEKLLVARTNPAAERIFKCSAKDMLGRSIRAFFPGSDAERLFTQARAGQKRTDDQRSGNGSLWAPEGIQARRGDGEPFPVELTLSPLNVDGEIFWTLILRDVNDRRRAEDELRRLRADKRLLQEQLLQEQLSRHANIIGESPAMAAVLSHVEKVAATNSTVLILGETGTGKELIARAIHGASDRRDRVLVTVNCAALPKDLLESELFGHEKGAFTGATQHKRGRFEVASGGTLFLDEVGELSAEAQAKLLRALQEGEIQRVGGEQPIQVDVRLVAATHRDLATLVETGGFRSDLYYRLSVFPLRVPPLRERRTDIALLVDHFVSIYAARFGKPLTGFDEGSLEKLLAYPWPGNVRELQNIIERAAILAGVPLLTLDAGPLTGPFAEMSVAGAGQSDGDEIDSVLKQHLERVLAECGGIIEGSQGAAVRLGIKPSTLRFRMKKLGVHRPSS